MLKKYMLFFFFTNFLCFVISIYKVFLFLSCLENFFKSIKNNYSIIYFGDSVIKADHKQKKIGSNLVNILESEFNSSILEVQGPAYNNIIYN